MCLQESYERRTETAYYGELDDSIANDEAVDAISAEIWLRDVCTPMSVALIRGAVLAEAIGAVLAGCDDQDLTLLEAAQVAGDESFGRHMMSMVRDYLEAQIRERACAQFEYDRRQAEDDAATNRMAT